VQITDKINEAHLIKKEFLNETSKVSFITSELFGLKVSYLDEINKLQKRISIKE
jgi:MoxR-like ATPase